jgi:hypothetical protein
VAQGRHVLRAAPRPRRHRAAGALLNVLARRHWRVGCANNAPAGNGLLARHAGSPRRDKGQLAQSGPVVCRMAGRASAAHHVEGVVLSRRWRRAVTRRSQIGEKPRRQRQLGLRADDLPHRAAPRAARVHARVEGEVVRVWRVRFPAWRAQARRGAPGERGAGADDIVGRVEENVGGGHCRRGRGSSWCFGERGRRLQLENRRSGRLCRCGYCGRSRPYGVHERRQRRRRWRLWCHLREHVAMRHKGRLCGHVAIRRLCGHLRWRWHRCSVRDRCGAHECAVRPALLV